MNSLNSKKSFTDYLTVLIKWKKFLFITWGTIVLSTTIVTFLIPVTYRATATVMVPPESSAGLSGLGGILSGKSSSVSLGSKLFGVTSTSEDVLLGILNSRSAIINVINKFDLFKYYDINDSNFDKIVKVFRSDVSFETNEFGMIDINVINKNPKLCAEMANYIVKLLDSLNIKLNIEAAHNNRLFIENRYWKTKTDLKSFEDSMYIFQKKYGIFAVPQQIEAAIKSSTEIESELIKKEMMYDIVKSQYGINSPQINLLSEEIKLLREKVAELKSSSNLSSKSNILIPFSKFPDIYLSYYKIYRDIEIQNKLLEFVLPMYEQAKVEEQKSIPTIMVLDLASLPQLKHAPKRSLIIFGIAVLSLSFLLLIIFRGDIVFNRVTAQNRFEEIESKFYNSLQRLFHFNVR